MRGVTLLLAIAGAAFPLVVGYHVEPVKAAWSGWTSHQAPYNRVSEVITCNFDSLSYVELFAGVKGNGGAFAATVFEGNTQLMTSLGNTVPDHGWVRFENWNTHVAYTKGKQYEFRFTRSGSVSIQYYCDNSDPYKYGQMPGDFQPALADLCARVYGRMNAVASDWWSIVPGCPWNDTARLSTWRDGMETLAVKRADFSIYWDAIEGSQDSFDFTALGHDVRAYQLDSLLKCALDARPQLCPSWASSRVETSGETCHYCAPVNLFRPVSDSSDSTGNYWARFVRRTVEHYDAQGDPIHIWTGWNEPNDTLDIGSPPTTGWWRRPDTAYYKLGAGARGLCSLYVQLCLVAESVIHHSGLTKHEHDRFLIGSTSRVRKGGDWDTIIVPGDTWIWMCYDIATGPNGPGVFWDGVAVHPYHLYADLHAESYEADALRVHEIMREFEHSGEVWNQELGWGYSEGAEKQARNLAEAFVTTKGSEAVPAGGYDGMMWYTLLGSGRAEDQQQILDSGSLAPRPASYAFLQLTHKLTGKRFNGRVMDGDTTVDNHVRMYEFESPATLKRTWVCWKDGDAKQSVDVKLPVRTSSLAAESLAYSKTPPTFSSRVADDGWLSVTLNARPVFISEKAPPMRPDLRVDSVRVVPTSLVTIRAWVTNHGTGATPVRSGSRVPYPTWAVLRANGDSLAQQVRTTSIAVNQQAEFTFDLGQTQLPDTALLTVIVNPSQTYVELGTDDNTGHALAVKP